MSAGLTPAGREDVPTVVTRPVVEGSLPAVEGDVDHVFVDVSDRGAADKMGVLLVHRFQLLSDNKPVHLWCGRLLLEGSRREQ